MNITLDMGNTNIYIGVYQDGTLVHTFRTLTDKSKSYDEYLLSFREFKSKLNLSEPCDGAIVSSVVPSLTMVVVKAISNVFETEVKIVGPGLKTGLQIKMDNPNEVGADLVCDGVGALTKYGPSTLIVDLGTASKIIVIDKNGCFAGGVVMPGIMISMKALLNNAALLTESSLIAPKNIVGKNTPDAMNSGAIYGTISSIEGLCKKIEKELGYNCQKVLTGGYGELVKENISEEFIYDKDLILDGLYNIMLRNNK